MHAMHCMAKKNWSMKSRKKVVLISVWLCFISFSCVLLQKLGSLVLCGLLMVTTLVCFLRISLFSSGHCFLNFVFDSVFESGHVARAGLFLFCFLVLCGLLVEAICPPSIPHPTPPHPPDNMFQPLWRILPRISRIHLTNGGVSRRGGVAVQKITIWYFKNFFLSFQLMSWF